MKISLKYRFLPYICQLKIVFGSLSVVFDFELDTVLFDENSTSIYDLRTTRGT